MSFDRSKGFGLSGLEYKKNEVPPPPSKALYNKQGYQTMSSIAENALSGNYTYGQPKKRAVTEDEYFDNEEEELEQAYLPAPGSPGVQAEQNQQPEDSDEEDPLDAFMAGIDEEAKRQVSVVKKKEEEIGVNEKESKKEVRQDIDNEDVEESYYRYMEENPNAGRVLDESDDEEIDYDEDGNPIAPVKSKHIDPLPPIDHSEIVYEEFTKNFYTEHDEIGALGLSQVQTLREKLGIKAAGYSIPKPVTSFGHFGFDEHLIKVIRKSEYTQPTPIQAQSIPIALSGRDMIGIAKTGSGKTAAFLWPLLIHIMDQKELKKGDGPIGLILAPTRELAQQIHGEAKRFGKVYNIHVVCAYGGGNKWEQTKALEEGAEIVVATPGRMIDMIKAKATDLKRVTYLVLDEADRMFDMGFEPQVRSICDHVRPGRQTLLFSATFKRKVENLAQDILIDPIRVVQGELGVANEDVTQKMIILQSSFEKWDWLLANLVEFTSSGSLLVFVTKKANAVDVAKKLQDREHEVLLLHGDMSQFERNDVITAFKNKASPVLVATDVAARGLDIPHIKTVVNYDMAKDIDTHTHRIGRTGRAGEKGLAYTLVTNQDKEFAGHLVRNLEGANQEVPPALLDLAMKSSWFRQNRFFSGGAKALEGRFLGTKERPGLGSETFSGSASKPPPPAIKPVLGPVAQLRVGPAAQARTPDDPINIGPASNRLSAMKSAFKSQYISQFVSSAKNTPWSSEINPENLPSAQSTVQNSNQSNSSEAQKETSRRKRSRWD